MHSSFQNAPNDVAASFLPGVYIYLSPISFIPSEVTCQNGKPTGELVITEQTKNIPGTSIVFLYLRFHLVLEYLPVCGEMKNCGLSCIFVSKTAVYLSYLSIYLIFVVLRSQPPFLPPSPNSNLGSHNRHFSPPRVLRDAPRFFLPSCRDKGSAFPPLVDSRWKSKSCMYTPPGAICQYCFPTRKAWDSNSHNRPH